ncbi:MAG: ADP-forming succinate--CoA ligase subunit beta [Bacteroidota bacterium]|nr:ADP-forming succinate--CoA ligase subunit beta [Bacteroidota bacterium]MEC8032420.1 ADP-forming succinate--CoA ligase subunit beta [Bacteroidota bacterium]MEC8756931.1 ADP-forming succinate--CoA ligase subunit beta [Bacteroidota bacterium]MEC8835499.1 ADP-forming succinate--CoA ligase subunit beta [Bacteroidota bacterium]
MNLHEYQAKNLLKKYGARIQEGVMIESTSDATAAAQKLTDETGTSWYVVKAQVHAGGRGKAGGVKLAKGIDKVEGIVDEILGMTIVNRQTGPAGKLVRKVLIAQDVYYPGEHEIREFYVSLLLDRAKGQLCFIYSTEGGMDIEEVAESTPEKVCKEWIDPNVGLQGFQVRKMAFNLGLSGQAFKNMCKFLSSVYKAYVSSDASLVEINPCLIASDEAVIAVDGKISLDGNGLFRQKDLAEMRDVLEEDPTEVEAGEVGLSYVKLDGNVGCMVNGAGLAMATMDMIKIAGQEPANFLDVGGTADAKRVETAFRIILKDPNVKAILVNIFGGIVRCDRVAQGIVDAYKSIGNIPVPIIVRLQGTNASEAKEIIDQSGLKVYPVIQLKDAAQKVEEVLA